MLVWDGKQVAAVDGRETAPAAATDQLFMKEGKPMAFYEGGGRALRRRPGTVRALALAHERYGGKLPWATLFEPAITLAEQGFVISPRLATLLAKIPIWPGIRTPAPTSIRRMALPRRQVPGSPTRFWPGCCVPWQATAPTPSIAARWPRPWWPRCTPTRPTPGC